MTQGARTIFSRAAPAALCLAALSPVASTPASAMGFFEALFGRRDTRPQPVYVQPPSRFDVGAPLAPQKAKKKPRLGKSIEPRGVAKTGLARQEPPPGPLGPFLIDPTLRRGDAVVTAEGVKIFAGSPGSRHAAEDFLALPQAARVVAGRATDLGPIDKAARFFREAPAPSPAPVPVADAARPDKQAAIDVKTIATR